MPVLPCEIQKVGDRVMPLFTHALVEDLNRERVNRYLAKLVPGASVDIAHMLWLLSGQHTSLNANQMEQAGRIRQRVEEITLGFLESLSRRYVIFYSDPAIHPEEDLCAKLSQRWKTMDLKTWAHSISRGYISLGKCCICNNQEHRTLPILQEWAPKIKQFSDPGFRFVHDQCVANATCDHCTAKIGDYVEVTYTIWVDSRLCTICYASAQDIIKHVPTYNFRELKQLAKRWRA